MKIKTLNRHELRELLFGSGIVIPNGVTTARVRTDSEQVVTGVHELYAEHQILDQEFADFELRITSHRGIKGWSSKPTRMICNGQDWYAAPKSLAYACLEWGLNWFVLRNASNRLMIHAACLEKDGVGLILPGHSGAGKSTLCCALACSGWRLLSDELTVLDLDHLEMTSFSRPICLKGPSISVIQDKFPGVSVGPVGHEAISKRPIRHIAPPTESVRQRDQVAFPKLIVFPQYEAGAGLKVTEISAPKSLISLAQFSFTYSMLGKDGFHAMKRLVSQSRSWQLQYSDLDQAILKMSHLARQQADVCQMIS